MSTALARRVSFIDSLACKLHNYKFNSTIKGSTEDTAKRQERNETTRRNKYARKDKLNDGRGEEEKYKN
jgi:hypothetical protein